MARHSSTKKATVFGARLATLRKAKGLTQPELGKQLGISTKMVDYYEHRARNPSIAIVQKAADLFDVSVADLLGEDAAGVAPKRRGPRSALEEKIERLRMLPKGQQEVVLKMLDGLLGP
jgi:transcriptional regulator with XRE-family HTH domain